MKRAKRLLRRPITTFKLLDVLTDRTVVLFIMRGECMEAQE